MESVTFDSTASSIQIKASVSTAGRQTAISLQQHLPNKTSVLSADLSFLNSDTKRMYKLGNQRIIKECHYNYQSLKASQQYSRLKFHTIYFIFKSPDICDPLSKYGKGGVTLSTRCSTQDILSPLTQGKTLGSQMLLKPLLTGKASFAKSHIF